MIFSDKIIMLRKKNGWSQEELANEIGVSRQSVSKWEGAQSVPDLNKILKLSKLFGVSTDYLLRDDIDEIPQEEKTKTEEKQEETVDEDAITMSVGDVTEFFKRTDISTLISSLSLAAMIFSGMTFFVSAAISNVNNGLSIITLTASGIILAAAVIAFIVSFVLGKKYSVLRTERVILEYGGAGVAEDKKERYGKKYKRMYVTGYICFGLGALLLCQNLLLSAVRNPSMDTYVFICQIISLLLFSAGAFLTTFGISILRNISCILEEGRYSTRNKKKNAVIKVFSSIYLCVLIFLTVLCFFVFPGAVFYVVLIGLLLYGVLYAALVSSLIRENKKL